VIQELKAIRQTMRLSLTATAHRASISRFRLWSAEQGTLTLTPDELVRVREALFREAMRLQGVFRDLEAVGA